MQFDFDLSGYLIVFLLISVAGLVISLCTEQSQIVAKLRGAMRGKIASGYNTAMKVMIVNRFGTILYTFFIALAIDVGVTNARVIAVAVGAAALVLLYNLYLLINSQRVLLFAPEGDSEARPWYKIMATAARRYAIASYVATLLNVLGLTLPLLLANSVPEYRLSMANTGFLLNTFFTLINVLLLEAKIAELLDKNNQQSAYEFAVTIFVTRALATLTAIGIYLWLLRLLAGT